MLIGIIQVTSCTKPSEAIVTITNELGNFDITSVYIDSASGGRTANFLDERIAPGNRIIIDVQCYECDIIIVDQDGDRYTRENLSIDSLGYNWVVSYSDYDNLNEPIGENEELLRAGLNLSSADARLLADMGEAGCFADVDFMTGYDNYVNAITNYKYVIYLQDISNESQGYFGNREYPQYQTFLNNLAENDFSYNKAIEALDSAKPHHQLIARNRLAEAGFGESYYSINETERSFVEEVLHINDSTGDPGNRDWAGTHPDLLNYAKVIVHKSIDGFSFGGYRRMESLLSRAATSYDVEVSDIVTYTAYCAALDAGSPSWVSEEYRNKIIDFGGASRGFTDVRSDSGLGARGTQGNIFASQVQAILMAGCIESELNESEAREVWLAFRDDGSFE